MTGSVRELTHSAVQIVHFSQAKDIIISVLGSRIGTQYWKFYQSFTLLHCSSGSSLILKKGCLHKARLGYTPLVEVNQAINAWSFKTTADSVTTAPTPPVQIVHFSQA